MKVTTTGGPQRPSSSRGVLTQQPRPRMMAQKSQTVEEKRAARILEREMLRQFAATTATTTTTTASPLTTGGMMNIIPTTSATAAVIMGRGARLQRLVPPYSNSNQIVAAAAAAAEEGEEEFIFPLDAYNLDTAAANEVLDIDALEADVKGGLFLQGDDDDNNNDDDDNEKNQVDFQDIIIETPIVATIVPPAPMMMIIPSTSSLGETSNTEPDTTTTTTTTSLTGRQSSLSTPSIPSSLPQPTSSTLSRGVPTIPATLMSIGSFSSFSSGSGSSTNADNNKRKNHTVGFPQQQQQQPSSTVLLQTSAHTIPPPTTVQPNMQSIAVTPPQLSLSPPPAPPRSSIETEVSRHVVESLLSPPITSSPISSSASTTAPHTITSSDTEYIPSKILPLKTETVLAAPIASITAMTASTEKSVSNHVSMDRESSDDEDNYNEANDDDDTTTKSNSENDFHSSINIPLPYADPVVLLTVSSQQQQQQEQQPGFEHHTFTSADKVASRARLLQMPLAKNSNTIPTQPRGPMSIPALSVSNHEQHVHETLYDEVAEDTRSASSSATAGAVRTSDDGSTSSRRELGPSEDDDDRNTTTESVFDYDEQDAIDAAAAVAASGTFTLTSEGKYHNNNDDAGEYTEPAEENNEQRAEKEATRRTEAYYTHHQQPLDATTALLSHLYHRTDAKTLVHIMQERRYTYPTSFLVALVMEFVSEVAATPISLPFDEAATASYAIANDDMMKLSNFSAEPNGPAIGGKITMSTQTVPSAPFTSAAAAGEIPLGPGTTLADLALHATEYDELHGSSDGTTTRSYTEKFKEAGSSSGNDNNNNEHDKYMSFLKQPGSPRNSGAVIGHITTSGNGGATATATSPFSGARSASLLSPHNASVRSRAAAALGQGESHTDSSSSYPFSMLNLPETDASRHANTMSSALNAEYRQHYNTTSKQEGGSGSHASNHRYQAPSYTTPKVRSLPQERTTRVHPDPQSAWLWFVSLRRDLDLVWQGSAVYDVHRRRVARDDALRLEQQDLSTSKSVTSTRTTNMHTTSAPSTEGKRSVSSSATETDEYEISHSAYPEVMEMDHVLRVFERLHLHELSMPALALGVRAALAMAGWGGLNQATEAILSSYYPRTCESGTRMRLIREALASIGIVGGGNGGGVTIGPQLDLAWLQSAVRNEVALGSSDAVREMQRQSHIVYERDDDMGADKNTKTNRFTPRTGTTTTSTIASTTTSPRIRIISAATMSVEDLVPSLHALSACELAVKRYGYCADGVTMGPSIDITISAEDFTTRLAQAGESASRVYAPVRAAEKNKLEEKRILSRASNVTGARIASLSATTGTTFSLINESAVGGKSTFFGSDRYSNSTPSAPGRKESQPTALLGRITTSSILEIDHKKQNLLSQGVVNNNNISTATSMPYPHPPPFSQYQQQQEQQQQQQPQPLPRDQALLHVPSLTELLSLGPSSYETLDVALADTISIPNLDAIASSPPNALHANFNFVRSTCLTPYAPSLNIHFAATAAAASSSATTANATNSATSIPSFSPDSLSSSQQDTVVPLLRRTLAHMRDCVFYPHYLSTFAPVVANQKNSTPTRGSSSNYNTNNGDSNATGGGRGPVPAANASSGAASGFSSFLTLPDPAHTTVTLHVAAVLESTDPYRSLGRIAMDSCTASPIAFTAPTQASEAAYLVSSLRRSLRNSAWSKLAMGQAIQPAEAEPYAKSRVLRLWGRLVTADEDRARARRVADQARRTYAAASVANN